MLEVYAHTGRAVVSLFEYTFGRNDYRKLEFESMHWGQPFFPMKKSSKKMCYRSQNSVNF